MVADRYQDSVETVVTSLQRNNFLKREKIRMLIFLPQNKSDFQELVVKKVKQMQKNIFAPKKLFWPARKQ